MKQKIFYMLAIICCMSFFSAAKQNDSNCNLHSPKNAVKAKSIKQAKQNIGYDVSPMRFLIFAI